MNHIVGIKDSANFTVKKKSDGKVFLYADYATVASNEWKHDSVYAKSKSTRAIRWDFNKESTLKATFEVFDLKWLSMLTGSDFVTGVTPIQKRIVLETSATNTITLPDTPKIGSLGVFLLESDNLTNGIEQTVGTPANSINTYSITGSVITLNATTAPEHTKVVCYYLVDSPTTSQKMTINANAFPFAVEIFADIMQRDTDNLDKYVQMHYLNAKAKGNFTVTMSASDITKLEIEFDLFKASDSDAMAEYTII